MSFVPEEILRDGVKWKVLSFTNQKGQEAKFNILSLDPLASEINMFTQKIASLKVRSSNLLAFLLNILPKAADFSEHDENLHTAIGSPVESDIASELNEHGGSIEDLKMLIDLAKEHAVHCDNPSSSTPLKRHLAKTIPDPIKAKVTKVDKREEKRTVELTDPDGLEKRFVECYTGFEDVALENLRPLPSLLKSVNTFKVEGIVKSILERPDPSLVCMTVAPDEEVQRQVGVRNYVVIGGIHTLLAFKRLESKGLLKNIHMFKEGLIPCVIVNTTDTDLLIYGRMRTKQLGSEFISPPRPQDLLKIFENYIDQPQRKGKKILSRLLTIQDVSQPESAAIQRLIQWRKEAYMLLLEVLKAYEYYETKDIHETRNRGSVNKKKLTKGQTLKLTAKMLIGLSNLDEESFIEMASSVLEQKVSLKSLVEPDPTEPRESDLAAEARIPEVCIEEVDNISFDESSALQNPQCPRKF